MASDKSQQEISVKMNVVISLLLKVLNKEEISSKNRKKTGVGDTVRYLSDLGLDSPEIAAITGSPLSSVRTLLTPKRRK